MLIQANKRREGDSKYKEKQLLRSTNSISVLTCKTMIDRGIDHTWRRQERMIKLIRNEMKSTSKDMTDSGRSENLIVNNS